MFIGSTVNLNGIGGTFKNKGRVEPEMIDIGGGGGLAQDDFSLAQSLKFHADLALQLGDKSFVVSRTYTGNEHELYLKMTPEQWLDRVQGNGTNGVVLQCHNEPGIGIWNVEAFVKWNIACIKEAHQRGLRIGVGTFSVRNPNIELIRSGYFDKMLTELNADDTLILHEYFIKDPIAKEEWGDSCGRLEEWMKRMIFLGCACRTIVLGEYGRDLGGGHKDGWRAQGWSPAYYASLLIKGMRAYLALAKMYGFAVYVDIFCAGEGGGGDWQYFNVENTDQNYHGGIEKDIFEALNKWNKENPMVQQIVPYIGKDVELVDLPGSNLWNNIRSVPNSGGADIGDLLVGDVVHAVGQFGDWLQFTIVSQIERPAGRQPAIAGWTSLQGGKVVFKEVENGSDVEINTVSQAVYDKIKQINELSAQLLLEVKPSSSGDTF